MLNGRVTLDSIQTTSPLIHNPSQSYVASKAIPQQAFKICYQKQTYKHS